MDWKDALAGLRSEMPEQETAGEASATEPPLSKTPLPTLEIVYERKGRAGKPATIICGFNPDDTATLREVASRLKRALACGGSERAGEILLQGDRRARASEILRGEGYKVKGA